MDYVTRVPRPPLDGLIDDLYCLTGQAPYSRMLVPPMPSAHLMITLTDKLLIHDAAPGVPLADCADGWFMGMWTRHYAVDWPTPVRLVGVHFKPWGVHPFTGIPMTELRDRVVPVEAIWGGFAGEVIERLHAAPTPEVALALLEKLLWTRLCDAPPPGLSLVQDVSGRISGTHGAVSIGSLSSVAGVSINHLGTQFNRHVGVPAKRIARIYRFAWVVRSLDPAGLVDWSELAHRAGYYDQSHFNKEFAAFTGLNPTEYLHLRRRFLQENPGHALDLGPLPV
jgi:AraC-like DNA-binding protein